MVRLAAFLIFLTSYPFAVSADLRSSLKSLGIDASFPGDASYASASRAYNLRFTIKPAAVTFPKTPQEVSEVVKVGIKQKLRVVPRSGGHSYIANGLGGTNGALVVDLRNLHKVTVNPNKGTAIIETGNRLGNVATALAGAGRALPHGTCPYVGIGGHTGGFGFTSRMWGLTLDTVTAVNLVLPNGTIATVNNKNYADLFWGLRGAAGSFGIATSFEVNTFQAPPSATVFEYTWNMNVADASKALTAFQSFVQTNIPPQFGAEINLGRGSATGTVSLSLVGGWYGPKEGLSTVLAPLLSQLPKKPKTTLHTGTYLSSVAFLGGGSLNTTNPDITDTFYAKSLMTPDNSTLSGAAISAFVKYLGNQGFTSNTNWFVQVELYGGKNSAINAVPKDATAFVHRGSTFNFQFYASSSNGAPPYPQSGFPFVDGIVNAIISHSPQNWNYGAYYNYIDDKLVDWQSRYYGAHYARLQSLKDKYDPRDTLAYPLAIED